MGTTKLTYILLTSILSFSIQVQGQTLTAVPCQAKLPSGRSQAPALYDGNNSIYIFGGYDNQGRLTETLKYSISSDTIEDAGNLPVESIGGASIFNNNGAELYHIAGNDNSDKDFIFKYNFESKNYTQIATFTRSTIFVGAINPEPNKLLVIDGSSNITFEVDLQTWEFKDLARLPKHAWFTSVIWLEDKGISYIFPFDPFGFFPNSNVMKYIRAEDRYEVLAAEMPEGFNFLTATWSGRYGYILGTYGNGQVIESILQFDPETEEFQWIPLAGDRSWTESPVNTQAVVYAEKVNSIFVFGGAVPLENRLARDIWQISLDPVEPRKGKVSA